MKKCPYCAEEIQDEAIKCRFCGESLKTKLTWYYKTHVLVMAFLCVGPLILPLIIIHPKYSVKTKVVISVLISVISIAFGWGTALAVKQIWQYYSLMFDML